MNNLDISVAQVGYINSRVINAVRNGEQVVRENGVRGLKFHDDKMRYIRVWEDGIAEKANYRTGKWERFSCVSKDGYPVANFWVIDEENPFALKNRQVKVHRMVALAFGWQILLNKASKETGVWVVCHKNGVKTDCRNCNLEFGTQTQNIEQELIVRNLEINFPGKYTTWIEIKNRQVRKFGALFPEESSSYVALKQGISNDWIAEARKECKYTWGTYEASEWLVGWLYNKGYWTREEVKNNEA